jgi:heme-binding HmuY-like protein
MKKNILLLVLVSFAFMSCFKEDKLVLPHEPGDVTTVVIPLTMDYHNQVYYDLEMNELVAISERSEFDLNFCCNDTSTIIRLNTANFALAAETNYHNLEDVVDTTGLVWYFDKSDGNPDSLAVNNWINIIEIDTAYSSKVWVINRGMSPLGINLGLIKIKFNSLVNGTFNFTFSNMDNSELTHTSVTKNTEYEYVQYSFSEKNINQTEPIKPDWDLLFTQYTTLLFTDEGKSYPYLVTGVIQKYTGTSVALDTSLVFKDITISDTSLFDFSASFDKIGYDWKELIGDVNTGNIYYQVKLNNTYIIKDKNSFYYKLRFVNFYDHETGEKGYPTFEYQML